ncbi:Glutathione S-transferase [Mycena sanguinolenta]|uniref:Glutathione S-transferase n=1 Tax=Mycena sanguinolenta TaxID=230812 RepID=A0A8H7D0U5_9AGAR|nr:Glutathione S-transferase [Mycena sanguinolenta]
MSVIIYRYNTSPYSAKIENVLLFKNILYEQVNVANVLPRPEITDLLGLTHRRIPILAIGNDIYCDTSARASFPPSQNYGTIFPNKKHGGGGDTGLIKAFVFQWVDETLFPLGVGLVPWASIPPAFPQRSRIQAMVAQRGNFPQLAIQPFGSPALHLQSAHPANPQQSLLEEQLSDGRDWLFETQTPSLADISVHFLLVWIKHRIPGSETVLDANTIPKLLEWLARMTDCIEQLKQKQPAIPELSGSDAAAQIVAAAFEPYTVVGFNEREAERLGLKVGDEVSVSRNDDTGASAFEFTSPMVEGWSAHKFGTVGKLVALNREEFVIETTGSAGLVRCHFPRIGFATRLVSELKK